MKYFSFVLLIVMAQAVSAQVITNVQWRPNMPYESGDSILYNPIRKLIWADFRGKPDYKSVAAAVTSSGFGFTMGMKSRNGKTVINIDVYCFYQKSTSWVKPGMASD